MGLESFCLLISSISAPWHHSLTAHNSDEERPLGSPLEVNSVLQKDSQVGGLGFRGVWGACPEESFLS